MSWQAILRTRTRAIGLVAVVVAATCALATLGGCTRKVEKGSRRGPASQVSGQGGLFESAVDSLDRLEQFEGGQILKQICDRLNQWYLQERPKSAWQADPLVATLRPELQAVPAVRGLDSMQYRLPDGWFLQESVWLRDISKTARGDQFDDLAVAERLFDWTVRNIQLGNRDELKQGNPHRPYEILLFGRGSALERAWVFMLLARHQGLDVVLLGLADEQGENVRPWVPALVKGSELYLFDPALGMPIPAPDGRGVATLVQAQGDEQLLQRLDLDSEHPYPVHAGDLKHVVAYLEATPINLSHRMALVESRLTGKHKLLLTSQASAVAERVKQVPQVAEVKLWPLPFEIWLRQSKQGEQTIEAAAREMAMFQALPSLLTARSLYFKGDYEGETGAKQKYLSSRLPDSYIDNYKLPENLAKQVKPERINQIEAAQIVMMHQAKQVASLWLGLIFFDQKDYADAIDFFGKRTLDAAPEGVWSTSARYNLARACEAQGDTDRAISLYEADKKSPQSHGNQLRARWLKEQRPTDAAAAN